MESGRKLVAAAGLFFGGLIIGSNPGVTREGNTAHAAAAESPTPRERSTRGPVAPALHKLMGSTLRSSDRADLSPIEAPKWSKAPPRTRERTFDNGDPDDPLAGLKMPDLPIPRTPAVLKYVRYFSESVEGRKTFSEALKRSGRYQDVIAKQLRELGLPKDLVAVAFIESGFNVEAISTAGACGMWQLMPATARAYGLTIESNIDERAGIWSSTEAAAHHLSDLYARFKSWELALAAYNMGYDGLERRLDEMDADDFWQLAEMPGGLPNETAHYVPKVLGAAVVFANLDELGFGDVERAPALDAAMLDVPPDTKLAVVARAAGTSVRTLRDLNPELLGDTVPGRDEHTTIHVPKNGASRARAMLPKIDADDPDTLRVSEDFDWGHDDAKSGRSRLERTSKAIREPRRRRHVPRREEKSEPKPRFEKPKPPTEDQEPDLARKDDDRADEAAETKPIVIDRAAKKPEAAKTENTRVLYRVVAGDSLQQIAATVGLTVDQVLAQAHVISASEIQVGTLLDLRVPAKGIRD
jgi:membrane-bound lytic murein transglycosylase D